MAKPLIGITTKTRFSGGGDFSSNTEIHHSPIHYIHSVHKAGGVPILLPLVASEEAVELWLDRLDGIILSGGMDVAPHLYGQEPVRDMGGIDGAKDDMEMILVPKLLNSDMPTLAICRGIQVVNVAAGGTLFQDVKLANDNPLKHSQRSTDERPTHSVDIAPDSWMHEVFGATRARVNSYHHQSVDRVAEGFRVTATASDGIIETMEHVKHRFMMCVQFHPELMTHLPEFHRLFETHVQACKK